MTAQTLVPPEEPPADPDFEAFWRLMRPALTKRMTRDYGPHEADDIVQETMIRAYAHWEQLDHEREPYRWLVRVAKNVATDRYRAEVCRTRIEGSVPPDPRAPDLPEDVACVNETCDEVRSALGRLRDSDRTVVLQHYVGGLTAAEIAVHSGRKAGAVRAQMHRARGQMEGWLTRVGTAPPAVLPVRLYASRLGRFVDHSSRHAAAVICALTTGTAALTGSTSPGAAPAPAPLPVVAHAPDRTQPAHRPTRSPLDTVASAGAAVPKAVAPHLPPVHVPKYHFKIEGPAGIKYESDTNDPPTAWKLCAVPVVVDCSHS